jgi:hypothetical protein
MHPLHGTVYDLMRIYVRGAYLARGILLILITDAFVTRIAGSV